MCIIFLEQHTPEKSELEVKDYEDNNCGDDSDKDPIWKPKINFVFDKSNLNNLSNLNIDTF